MLLLTLIDQSIKVSIWNQTNGFLDKSNSSFKKKLLAKTGYIKT